MRFITTLRLNHLSGHIELYVDCDCTSRTEMPSRLFHCLVWHHQCWTLVRCDGDFASAQPAVVDPAKLHVRSILKCLWFTENKHDFRSRNLGIHRWTTRYTQTTRSSCKTCRWGSLRLVLVYSTDPHYKMFLCWLQEKGYIQYSVKALCLH